MRIAFLADPLDKQSGGIHIYTKELLGALSQVDKENEYLIIRAEQKQEFEGMEEVQVPYYSIPGYRAWRLFFELPRLLEKRGVDVVVEPAHFGPFNLPKSIKRVTVIHDLTMFLFPEYHVFSSQFLQRLFLPRILKNADQIITNSTNTTKDLIQFFPFTANKTNTILLGKNKQFSPTTNQAILEKHRLEMPYFLYTGTIEPRKNLLSLVQAFNHFKAATRKAHQLVLIGKKGWKSEAIFSEITNSPFKGSVIILGYVDIEELPVLYSMAELFVYPSNYEGFGLPILEAMACGTPVITSNSSSLPEVGGSAAHYCSPDLVGDLSEKMIALSADSDLRQRSRQLGLKQATKFSWEKAARETIAVFDQFR